MSPHSSKTTASVRWYSPKSWTQGPVPPLRPSRVKLDKSHTPKGMVPSSILPRPLDTSPEKPSQVSFGSSTQIPNTNTSTLLPTTVTPPHHRANTIMPHSDRPNVESEVNRLAVDQGDDTYGEKAKESNPNLESLMEIHKPVDLNGQIVIPDRQHPIYGGLAVVYVGYWQDKKVAVKVPKVRRSEGEDAYIEASNTRRIKREINVWAALKHRNICELIGFSSGLSDYPATVSLWCQRGTTVEYLARYTLSVKGRINLARDVCIGLQYLHQLGIIHGDLKPTNILVDDGGVAQLCDFGLVRLADWEGPAGLTTTSPYTGTARYKAPELFMTIENRFPVATFEGDIYSLGCILLEFVERFYPFKRFKTTREVGNAIMDGYSPALRSEASGALLDMTEYFWNLLEACWDGSSGRPTIEQVVEALNYFTQTMSTTS